MKRINMLSKADMVKGQGVLSAHDEQVELAREMMENRALISENAKGSSDITHYHSINPEYYLSTFRRRKQGSFGGICALPAGNCGKQHSPSKVCKKNLL